MIELPVFSDEQWYLTQAKKLFLHGNVSDRNVDSKFNGSAIESDLINTLSMVIDPTDVAAVSSGSNIFEKIVLAPYPVLRDIFDKVRKYPRQTFQIQSGQSGWSVKPEWQPFCHAYDTMVKRHNNTKLIEQYGVKCCPYCNESYIFNRKDKASAQLDHFFPKERYPLFAISLYNLVPSCPICNHIKHEKLLGLSPHDHTRDFEHMRISYTPKSIQWIEDYHMLDVDFQCDPTDPDYEKDMMANLDRLLLKDSYQNHRDYIQEIIYKAFLYNDSSMSALLNSLPGAFNSEEEMLRVIFGNYVKKDKLLKRPLSKLTRDMLIELKILPE